MTKTAKRREKELAIYNAVLALIAQGADVNALTVQQIAEAADIGKGTVYEYFPSKDAILQGMRAYCMESEMDRLQAATANCATLEGLLDAALGYLTDLAGNRAGIYRIISGSLGGHAFGCAGCCDAPPTDRLEGLMHDVLGRLRANGQIDATLPEEYCFYALAAAAVSCVVLLLAAGAPGKVPTPPAPAVLQNTRLLLKRALCPPAQL